MAYISFQPSDYYSTNLYTGNYTGASSEQVFTDIGFGPDFVWIKGRNATEKHVWTDTVRGATETLSCNTNSAQSTDAQYLKAFSSTGFTIGASNETNENGKLFASRSWKAGTTTGLSGGTITPTAYSFNATSGFGMYAYAGTSAAGTIAHGLGTAPECVIVKKVTGVDAWWMYHKDMGTANYGVLNTNGAIASNTGAWNDTAPTDTLIHLGDAGNTNSSSGGNTYIMYAFAPVKGFSAISSYRGNGNTDGPFVQTGFRPAFVMIKYHSAGNWYIFNNKALGYNPDNEMQYADLSNAEGTTDAIDFLSNGFKLRHTDTGYNANNETYYYIAFAEFPFVSSNSKAVVAR